MHFLTNTPAKNPVERKPLLLLVVPLNRVRSISSGEGSDVSGALFEPGWHSVTWGPFVSLHRA